MKQNDESQIILALLRNKKLHVRGIAKALGQPHSNISRAMESLLKKNIVDFKTEGRNKVFQLKKGLETINFIYKAEHDKLLDVIERYPLLSPIIESILKKCNSKLIIIFGSFAKFKAKKDSDIDVFIETNDAKIKKAVEDINSRLSVKTGRLDLNNLLVKEIIKDHLIVRGVEYFYEKNRIFD